MVECKIRDSHWHIYAFYDKDGRDFFAAADAVRKLINVAALWKYYSKYEPYFPPEKPLVFSKSSSTSTIDRLR